MLKFLYVILSFYALTGCSQLNKKAGLEDDNIIEELSEDVIKVKTGYDIDLTPMTPERRSPPYLLEG